MVRLKDIAARAGVSMMTVSKALRDGRDVKPATRERIRQLAQEMGYVPDARAQSLRSRTSRLFGVVISSLANPLVAPWAGERLEGYRRALREADLEVDERLVFSAGSTIEDGAKAGLQMLNENCDATAVQAVNDPVAIGCAETLLSQGLKIPQDVS